MNNTANATDSTRCNTSTKFVRADDLRLNDQILVANFRGRVDLVKVYLLALEGSDDVVINGNLTTSVGNTFQVVGLR